MELTENLMTKASSKKSTKRKNYVSRASVDTLRLWISNTQYQISDMPDLKVVPGGNKYLWTDSSGRKILGSTACHITHDIRVELRSYHANPNFPPDCYVTFSAPKHKYGHNALPINKEQLQGVLRGIEDFLYGIGITTDIMAATVSRIDIFRDIELTHKPVNYFSILQETNFPYMTRRRKIKSWIAIHNKQRTIAFYDKGIEVQEKFPGRFPNLSTSNILRCEYRLKKAKVVQDALNSIRGIEKTSEPLLVADLVNKYDLLMSYHLRSSEKYFQSESKANSPFWIHPEYAELSIEEIHQKQCTFLVDEYKERARQELSKIQTIEAEFGGGIRDKRDQIVDNLLSQKFPRSRSAKTRTNQVHARRLGLSILPSGIPYACLDKELSEKLCSPSLTQITRPKAVPLPGSVTDITEILKQDTWDNEMIKTA